MVLYGQLFLVYLRRINFRHAAQKSLVPILPRETSVTEFGKMSEDKKKPSRRWVFTINNYTPEDIELFEKIDCKYVIVGDEVGDSGTPHLQGFIIFNRGYRLTQLKKIHEKAYWDYAVTVDAMNYCMKQKVIILRDYRAQGSRTDWNSVRDMVDSGASFEDIRKEHYGLCMQYGRAIEQDIARKRAKTEIKYTEFNREFINLDEHPIVSLVGPTGIGKTQYAKAHFNNPLIVRHIDDLRNFTDHDGIIFDDMDFVHWPVTSQIHLTDIEENSSINIKYGTASIPKGTKRIFTSNTYPFAFHPAIDRRVYKEFIDIKLF